jgi:hypothetical protein
MLTSFEKRKKFMRIWLVLPVIFLFLNASAQNSIPDVSISIDAQATLAELLDIIAKKSGVRFSYNPKKIPVDEVTRYTVVNKTVSAILKDISERFNIKYTLVEGQIILKPDKRSDKPEALVNTLSGTIKDAGNGEALIGATVLIKELQTGTVTNAFGFFSITIPEGKYTVSTSFLGYKDHVTTVDLSASIQQDIVLEEELPVLEEIVVSNGLPDVVQEITSGNTHVRPKTVEERPALFGEMDVVKSLETAIRTWC